MNGQIGLESAAGHGSTFWVRLTLKKSAEAKNPVVQSCSNTQAATLATEFPRARIMVAEDNAVNQKIALMMLQKIGYHAQAVSSGSEVLAALKDIHYDLILMDCQMPDMDGFEATQAIRSLTDAPYKSIPIVAMTANALSGDRERCLKVGMDDYTTKPVKAAELHRIIEKWLALRSKTLKKSA